MSIGHWALLHIASVAFLHFEPWHPFAQWYPVKSVDLIAFWRLILSLGPWRTLPCEWTVLGSFIAWSLTLLCAASRELRACLNANLIPFPLLTFFWNMAHAWDYFSSLPPYFINIWSVFLPPHPLPTFLLVVWRPPPPCLPKAANTKMPCQKQGPPRYAFWALEVWGTCGRGRGREWSLLINAATLKCDMNADDPWTLWVQGVLCRAFLEDAKMDPTEGILRRPLWPSFCWFSSFHYQQSMCNALHFCLPPHWTFDPQSIFHIVYSPSISSSTNARIK